MNISIGGISLGLEVDGRSLRGIITDLCSIFVSPLPVEWRVVIVPEGASDGSGADYLADNEGYRIRVDLVAKSARILIRQRSALICANALKNLCGFLLAERGGVLLHAAGILHRGKACLFIGPPGSGKSTVTALSSREHAILSQEAIGVFEADSAFLACALPYAADCSYLRRSAGAHEVAGLFYLVQDKRNFLVPKRRSTMLADMAHAWASGRTCLERAGRFVERVRCYDLHFVPDDSFWRCIDACMQEEVSCA